MYNNSPYPGRLERLTICRYNYRGSTFSQVFLRPWVLVRSGAQALDLPRSSDWRSANRAITRRYKWVTTWFITVNLDDIEAQGEERWKSLNCFQWHTCKTELSLHIDLFSPYNFYLLFFFKGKQDSPRSFLPENDVVPLNEYRRNRLMRLSEMLRDKWNRFEDAMEEKRTTVWW